MSEIVTEKLIVVKHNDLIDAAQKLSIIETRILLTCIAQIDSMQKLEPDTKFTLHVSDIADVLGTDIASLNCYENLKDAVARLYQREVIFLRPSTRINESRVRWVFQINYLEAEGTIELFFSPPIIKLLSEINRDFTKYKLSNVLKFRCQYSVRVYELICRWGGTSKYITIEELKEQLDITGKYERWDKFKEDVLDLVVLDLATSNVSVSWEGVKKGRKFVALKFKYKISNNLKLFEKKPTKVLVETTTVSDLDYYADLRKRFGKNAPIPKEIEALLKEQGRW